MARVRQVMFINWSSCCLGLEVLCVIAFLQSTDAAAGRLNLQRSELNWWDARSKCREDFMSDLFIPEYEPTGITLTPGEDYWLGVMRYSTWKWTQDFTDLYRYIGYKSILDHDSERPVTLKENSVYECNRKCTDHQLFGLSGKNCYCLAQESQVSIVQSASEEQCTGNLDEKCGNANGMSIYKLDYVVFDLQSTRRCSYAQKQYGVEPSITVTASGCSYDRYHACFSEGPPTTCRYHFSERERYCHGNVCISCYKYNWYKNVSNCQRLKINASSHDDLLNVAYEGTKYWIGLYKFCMEASVNGTRFFRSVRYEEEFGFGDYYCLSVRLLDGEYEKHWLSCSEEHKAICDVVPAPPTVNTTLAAPLETRPSTISHTSSERSVSEANVEGDQEMKNSNDKLTGVYVGACIGGVLLLTLTLILLVVLKRQGKLCFKKIDNEVTAKYNAATVNVTYDIGPSNPGLPVISARSGLSPSSKTKPPMLVPNANQNSWSENSNTKDTPIPPNLYSEVVSPGRFGSKENSDFLPVQHDVKAIPIQNKTPKDDGECGVDDDYDTTRQMVNPGKTDNCYHHIMGTEDDYDVAGYSRQDNATSDAYNHLENIERQGRSTKDKEDIAKHTGRQHKLGEDEYGQMETSDYYNISSSTNGDYYNVGFTSDEQHSEKPSRQGEDGETVYTLASAVSDI